MEAPPSKRSKRQAKRAAEAQEEATRAAELARLAGEGPRDAAFYEREVRHTCFVFLAIVELLPLASSGGCKPPLYGIWMTDRLLAPKLYVNMHRQLVSGLDTD